ncbi:hypothetical protein OG304_11410 [Streptomyces sp. NBC_00160]|uniref:hypothetical protein n=1 Tax=Streptomyces sp. NBC_00160 TaxID=2903628 RepID=UPI002250C0FB|nr:hypothetical protein [Streptomyces sp. NBC_00160]MCX5304057.1 hypothetical protein [Streptomyces sp. NBC_00160]
MGLLVIVIALAVVLAGIAAILATSAVLGYATVAASRRLPLGARIALLVALAAGSAAVWVSALGIWAIWRPAALALPFLTTVASGAGFLAREARKRHTPRVRHPAWPARH